MKKQTRYEYYDKNDQPITGKDAVIKWATQFEDNRQGRIVGQKRLWFGIFVSTVWLGLNHNWTDGEPHIYETMVFADELELVRYSTREQAIAGHKKMVLKYMNPFYCLYALWRAKHG